MKEYRALLMSYGALAQSALPKTSAAEKLLGPVGELVRGVVLATYSVDDKETIPRPQDTVSKGNRNLTGENVAMPAEGSRHVYCDVLAYSGTTGTIAYMIPRALVAPFGGGLHTGDVWRPRPTTFRIDGQPLDIDRLLGVNPGILDGDHVLVGFIDNDERLPVIIGSVPHPARDTGNEEKDQTNALPTSVPPQSTRLRKADGFPRLSKHHGVVWGVDKDGNFIIDATRAYDGVLDDKGREPKLPSDPPSSSNADVPATSGNIDIKLRAGLKARISISTDPVKPDDPATEEAFFELEDGVVTIAVKNSASNTPTRIKIEDNKVTVTTQGGAGIEVTDKDGDAKLKIGDGAMHATIVEHLEAMWNRFMNEKLTQWNTQGAAGSTFITALGPAFQVVPLMPEPWDPTINSTKVSLPDG